MLGLRQVGLWLAVLLACVATAAAVSADAGFRAPRKANYNNLKEKVALNAPIEQRVASRHLHAAAAPVGDWVPLPAALPSAISAVAQVNSSMFVLAHPTNAASQQVYRVESTDRAGSAFKAAVCILPAGVAIPSNQGKIIASLDGRFVYAFGTDAVLRWDTTMPCGNSSTTSSSSSSSSNGGWTVIPMLHSGRVAAVDVNAAGSLAIGTDKGTAFVIRNAGTSSPQVANITGLHQPGGHPNAPVTAITFVNGNNNKLAAVDDGMVAVGTGLRLHLTSSDLLVQRWWWVGGIIDSNITALASMDGSVFVGNNLAINVLLPDHRFHRVAGLQGLPYANVTSLVLDRAGSNRGVWVGTDAGLILWDWRRYCTEHGIVAKANANGKANTAAAATRASSLTELLSVPSPPPPPHNARNIWRYFNGPRYLPVPQGTVNTRVVAIAAAIHPVSVPISGGPTSAAATAQVVAVTAYGIARVGLERWTMGQKAAYMQSLYEPRHDRYGLTEDCGLHRYGSLKSFFKQPSDNSGLWTSLYVAAMSMRYAVTKDPAAKAAADKSFTAMEFLSKVTGIPGFPARSFVHKGDRYPTPRPHQLDRFYNSTAYPGWLFKADTSSDEITGHLFTYPIYYHLAANATAKVRAEALINSITGGMVKHNFELWGVFGNHTTWGDWNPASTNINWQWFDERGLNALQMVAFLLNAKSVTGFEGYETALEDLVGKNQYGQNLINAKITIPSDDNFSDDELTYLPYFAAWFSNVLDGDLQAMFNTSLARSYRINRPERSSLWAAVVCYIEPEACDAEYIATTLEEWVLEQINWPMQNSHRLDLFEDPEMPGKATVPISYAEQSFLRWNANPYTMNGGNGMNAIDAGAWVLPYWMSLWITSAN